MQIAGPLIGVAVGALLTFLFFHLNDYMGRRRRSEAHWGAIEAEFELCSSLAAGFLADTKKKTPLYRFPMLAYQYSFPMLLTDGFVAKAEAQAVTKFFSEVDTLNRGLDQAHEVRADPGRLFEEDRRNRVKAGRLDPSGEYYKALRDVLKTTKAR